MATKTTQPRRPPAGAATFRPAVTEAIVEAVLDELADKGYGGTSMDGVARRAGVGKSALYRRWPSKTDMIIYVMSQLGVTGREIPDTGSLTGDVRALLDDVRQWLGEPRMSFVFTDLIAEAQRNPALAQALTEHIGDPRRLHAQVVLDRAAGRGEIGRGVDSELIVDLFAAAIFWRMIARRVPLTEAFIDHVTAALETLIRTSTL